MTKIILIVALISATVFANKLSQKDLETIAKAKYHKSFNTLAQKEKQDIKKLLQKKLRVLSLAQKSDVSSSQKYKEQLENARKAILMNMYLKQKRDSIEVSHQEIQAYYKAHKRDYTQLHVRTIVRNNKEDIIKYIKILNNTPKQDLEEKFIELAKKYSQHPKKSSGGDMGYISYYTMAKPFGAKAFQLKPNTITQKAFATTLGWHIVYLKDKKITPLQNVEKNIEYKLRQDKYREWFRGI